LPDESTGMFLKPVPVKNKSGYNFKWQGKIPPLRKGFYTIEEDVSVGGDAPKDFIRVYEYGTGRKQYPSTWYAYIAKVGHKWYPTESVTEYLLNRIGEALGLNMAHSRLMVAGEQIRFLSRYFLKPGEQLVHGAEIFAGYVADKTFIEEIERVNQARNFFTCQFVENAIKHQFSEHADKLLMEFMKLLVFDAVIGNNDRHFYNWGIITNFAKTQPPRFSPIYDTARGLFWNKKEDWIQTIIKQPERLQKTIKKYIDSSQPKTGWEGDQNLNHFTLIERIYRKDERFCDVCLELLNFENLKKVVDLLHSDFKLFMSQERRYLIECCLRLRYERLNEILAA
jgi:hypothetical protein